MKFQLLSSTFDEKGCASTRQHLACFVIDDCVAIDAGSLAMAATSLQREQIRDVVLTHAHLDHIAGLPLFVDDLFATLEEPIRIHATEKVIDVLEKDIFNWDVYPSFSELENDSGNVLEYRKIKAGREFQVKHLQHQTSQSKSQSSDRRVYHFGRQNQICDQRRYCRTGRILGRRK